MGQEVGGQETKIVPANLEYLNPNYLFVKEGYKGTVQIPVGETPVTLDFDTMTFHAPGRVFQNETLINDDDNQEHKFKDLDSLVAGNTLVFIRFLPAEKMQLEDYEYAPFSQDMKKNAIRLIKEEHTSLEDAIFVQSQILVARKNAKPADPNGPLLIMFRSKGK